MRKVTRKRRKGGFTLIELIVVIAILGILIAIAVPNFIGYRDSAEAASNEAIAKIILNAAIVADATTDAADTWQDYVDLNTIDAALATAVSTTSVTYDGVTYP